MGDHNWTISGRDWENSHIKERGCSDLNGKYPYYSGSAIDYQTEHAIQYGGTERLAPDGSHKKADGSHEPCPRFPRGSSRERHHKVYKSSTIAQNQTKRAYETPHTEERNQFVRLEEEQKDYYKHTSGGLVSSAHGRLIPPACRFDESSNANAKGRLSFFDIHGNTAYHTLGDDNEHRDWATEAIDVHAKAHQARVMHNTYRPRPYDPTILDCYSNDPVWNHREHTRSRSQGLPPANTYCSRKRTPSPSGSESGDNKPRPSNDQQCKPLSGGKRAGPRQQLLMGNPRPHRGGDYIRR